MESTSEFFVEGIPVILTRKKVKNINFRVKGPDGRVDVSAPYWVDVSIIKKHVREKADWIRARQAQLQAGLLAEQKSSPQELAAAKKQLALRADPHFAYWEPRIGVQSKTRVYREMSSRWGSCNAHTGRICLNTRLLEQPEACLEYVVVHELCHLIEANHGPRFHALMDQHLPNWRARRAQLRTNFHSPSQH